MSNFLFDLTKQKKIQGHDLYFFDWIPPL